MKIVIDISNFFLKLVRNPYQAYVHRTEEVEAIIQENGFKQQYYRQTAAWQVVVYARG